jgi:hypothetical protein
MRSFKDMVAFTYRKLTSDSRRVTSAPVAVLNLPKATRIPDIGWKKITMFLMWVCMAALPQSKKDSVSSRPAT